MLRRRPTISGTLSERACTKAGLDHEGFTSFKEHPVKGPCAITISVIRPRVRHSITISVIYRHYSISILVPSAGASPYPEQVPVSVVGAIDPCTASRLGAVAITIAIRIVRPTCAEVREVGVCPPVSIRITHRDPTLRSGSSRRR